MYAETDFLLALLKDDDWLGGAAEAVYREHRDELWTSQFTLIELLLVAYREERDTARVVTNAAELVEARGDVDTVVAAATYARTTASRRSTRSTSSSPTATPSFPATGRTRILRRGSH
jgi:hypothetical protein